MTHVFDANVVAGVLRHMNTDHAHDNLLIARAFSPGLDVVSSTMTGIDGDGGTWLVTLPAGDEREVRVPWPGGSISERPEVRREIVALYDEACRILGETPRAHA